VTGLVCFHAFHEANYELEKARLRYRIAAVALRTVREKLDQALDEAYRQQSFLPLGNLLDEEEAAVAICNKEFDKVAKAEERWCALRAALAYEKEQMLAGPLSRKRFN
jgi:hypothetical protein